MATTKYPALQPLHAHSVYMSPASNQKLTNSVYTHWVPGHSKLPTILPLSFDRAMGEGASLSLSLSLLLPSGVRGVVSPPALNKPPSVWGFRKWQRSARARSLSPSPQEHSAEGPALDLQNRQLAEGRGGLEVLVNDRAFGIAVRTSQLSS